jgi:hypothetical protein
MADPQGGRLDPKSWPGTDAGGKQFSVNTDKVKQVIKALQADLDRFTNASEGTPDDMSGRGVVKDPRILAGGPDDKTGYPAGRTLSTYLTNASTNLPVAYKSFLTAYDKLIQSLRDQTGVYEDSNHANTASTNTATPTGYYGN